MGEGGKGRAIKEKKKEKKKKLPTAKALIALPLKKEIFRGFP